MGDAETPVRHIIPISGKDSLCTAIIQRQRLEVDYEYLFNPTGSELPEVFVWLKKVEDFLGAKINHVGRDLQEIIAGNNFFLPSRLARYCTRQSKIEPMLKYIGDDEAEVYFGIRADEDRKGFSNLWSPNISCNYPLKDAGIGIEDVYKIINQYGLKPPVFFWDRLYKSVKSAIGFDPKVTLPEWLFDSLFAWRSRANCFHCFNQRQYEIVGLWEHYPDLAEKALWYEKQGTSKGGYTWRERPFDWYRDNSDAIFDNRVRKITYKIRQFQQLDLFSEQNDLDFINLFTGSCGLLCGK